MLDRDAMHDFSSPLDVVTGHPWTGACGGYPVELLALLLARPAARLGEPFFSGDRRATASQ